MILEAPLGGGGGSPTLPLKLPKLLLSPELSQLSLIPDIILPIIPYPKNL